MQQFTYGTLMQLLTLVIETVPVGLALFDKQFILRAVNQRQADLHGKPRHEQLGLSVSDLLPETAAIIENKLSFVIEHKRPLLKQQIKTRIDHSGRQVYRLVSYFPILDDVQQVELVLAMIQDDCFDDMQFQVHQETQHRLLQVLDNLFLFVGVLDLDGTLISANRAPLEAAGITANQVLGKKFWDCYWWCYDSNIQQKISATIARCLNGEVCRFDLPARMSGGKLMWVDFMMAPLRDETGAITHLIPSAMDISQRHVSEIALHQSEEWLSSVIASSDEAIITKDLQGRVTSWNPAAERLLGYRAEEMLGQAITRIFPEDKRNDELQILERISRGEMIPPFETQRLHKSGKIIDISVSISPLKDKLGQVVGACKLARDISKEKQYTQMLELALEEKTSLLHEVHHRVKNNLQIVSSLLNLQSRRVNPEVAEALAVSQGRIKAMALIHQLLYESHNMSEVPLAEFLKKLLALSRPIYEIEKKGIELELAAGLNHSIKLDVQRMIPCGLIINELILNAIKHAFVGRERGKVSLTMRLQEQRVYIEVADNGIGLPADFSWHKQAGLGSQLIPMFAQQLKAELNYTCSHEGTRFELGFRYIAREPDYVS